MILSRACEYGIQALLFLENQPRDRFVTVRDIDQGHEGLGSRRPSAGSRSAVCSSR